MRKNIETILERISHRGLPEAGDIESLLRVEDAAGLEKILNFADRVRQEFMGNDILLRGIIEFSNYCNNNCYYCGLNKFNTKLRRYRLSQSQIIASVEKIVSSGIKTVILQSGEDRQLDAAWLKEIIEAIKSVYKITVTLSVGERSIEDYQIWRDAGASRYLLKIETTDKKLYQALHPGMNFENRLNCIRNLKSLGYETGSGNIIGLKGQTLRSIAEDILFFKREGLRMIGIGPFIPHPITPLAGEKTGELNLVLKALAITRIVTKNTNIPATTALASLGDKDYRGEGLASGANVLMLNFTPEEFKRFYEIYPGKTDCLAERLILR